MVGVMGRSNRSENILNKNQLWKDDSIQFPRLLTEMLMVGELQEGAFGDKEGLFVVDVKLICENMDLTWEQITEVFNRAQDKHEETIRKLEKKFPGVPYRHRRG